MNEKRKILRPLLMALVVLLSIGTAMAVPYEVRASDGEFDVYVDFSNDWAKAQEDPDWAYEEVVGILNTVASQNGFVASEYYASEPAYIASKVPWEARIYSEVWAHIKLAKDSNIHLSIYWMSQSISD